MRNAIRAAVVGATSIALIATAACGSSGDSATESATNAPGYPVRIDSALGTAEIKSKPTRVVTLGWGSTEAAVALGVVPVGMRDMKSDSGTVDGILPWVKDRLNGNTPTLLPETSQSIPVEQIAALKPDVILSVQSGLTADQYAQLSRIAPTVAQPGANWQTSWQDQTTIVGKALGKEKEAADLVSQTQSKVDAVKTANPEFAGKTVAAAGATSTDGLSFYFDADPRLSLLQGFGFTPLPALADLKKQAGPSKFAEKISWENANQYNADVLTVWYLDPNLRNAIEANPAFSSLPVVQKKGYVPLSDPPLVFAVSSPNVLDIPWLIDRYVPLLQTAAKGG